jgi:hypothetical protein
VPPPLKPLYRVLAGLGVYDRDATASGYPLQSATAVRDELVWAMRSPHAYAWLYTETHEWWQSPSGKPAVPQGWLDAVAQARSQGRN